MTTTGGTRRTPSHTSFPTVAGAGGGAGPVRLGRYDLVHRLATGGMAEVFLAVERGVQGLERRVVVKRILPHLAEHETFVQMFLQEARIVARLNHPNIVQIFELGEQDGSYFIGMEYVAGSSFRELMRTAAKQKMPVPYEVAIGLVAQACAGAHAAHELVGPSGQALGLVHRDISPHNLMVTSAGHVKLLDFGIAKATELGLDDKTRTGALKGKVHYMSPEQCRQETLDRRSDIFALGIVLWELITARRLFKRDSELETMQAIVAGEVWDPREFREGVPEPVVLATMRALTVNKEERYKTADEMRRALLDAASILGFTGHPDEVGPFVHEVLGDAHQRAEEIVQEALDRTNAAIDAGGLDATVLDRPAVNPTVDDSSRSGTTGLGSETLPPIPGAPRPAAISSLIPERRPVGVAVVFLIVASLVAAALGTTLWVLRNRSPVVAGEAIVVAWAPIVDRDLLKQELEPFRVYLEETTGRPFVFQYTDSYSQLKDKVLKDEVDFASLPPYIFLQTLAEEPSITAVAVNQYDGASGNDGVLLIREELGISDLKELKGKTWCYSDKDSTTGYVLPRATLKRAGLDPEVDLRPRRTGDHLQTLRDLSAGLCDVGGTYSGNYLAASGSGVNVFKLRQIAITGRSPNDALVATPSVPKADLELVGKAVRGFDAQTVLGRSTLGKAAKISGFVDPHLSDWDDIRSSLIAIGALPERAVADGQAPETPDSPEKGTKEGALPPPGEVPVVDGPGPGKIAPDEASPGEKKRTKGRRRRR